MSIKNTEIEIVWRNNNRKHYESLGYNFTNYGDKFTVKINDIPKHSEVKITAICDYCHKAKIMTLHSYNLIKGAKAYYKCRDCFNDEKILKYDTISKEVQESGYSILTPKEDYTNGYTRIKYLCPKHGIQEMRASNFHNGKRCPKCNHDRARCQYAFSSDEVFNQVKQLGGLLLNKDDYINNTTKNLKIVCPSCKKNAFTTSLRNFTQHGGQSCPSCSSKESVGERRIRQWLDKNQFDYIQQKWFKDCRDINPLPFDFYLPSQNTIIEFDGQQHFDENHFFSNHHLKSTTDSITSYTQKHDQIKNEYCETHNIRLIRIPYTKINNIESILQSKLIA